MKIIGIALLSLVIASAAFAQCADVSTLSCPLSVVASSLSSNDCAAFDGSKFDQWQFTGTTGQTVTIQMSSMSFDTLLMLLDPTGRPVAQNDDASPTTTDSRLTYTIDMPGTWTVIANSLTATGSGSYVITADLGCPIVAAPRRRSVAK